MISIISIGISDYKYIDVGNIDAAFSDAKNVYKTFKTVLGDNFSDISSFCFINLKSFEIRNLLPSFLNTNNTKRDICILYFSCHAQLEVGEKLKLVFIDEDGSGCGCISTNEIYEWLSRYICQFVIILDCCYSGAGIGMANKNLMYKDSNISVIASSKYYEKSMFNEKGSYFTNILCSSIVFLYENEKRLSINSLTNEIIRRNCSCIVNIAEGKEDIVFKDNYKIFKENKPFKNSFFKKLSFSNVTTREMMWYSLSDWPSSIVIDIIEQFIEESEKKCEASWLVRRAIGSVVGQIRGHDEKKYELINKMINSYNWMLQTIGLIAGRNIDKQLSETIKLIIIDTYKPMSLVWLANMYLADSNFRDISTSLHSNLSKTSWGVITIWSTYSPHVNNKELYETIYNFLTNKGNNDGNGSLLNALIEDLKNKNIEFLTEYHNYEANFLISPFVKLLYSQNYRGKIENIRQKWLLSILYGNWRGQLNINLNDFFNNFSSNEISESLQSAKNIPSVEIKSSIFNYLTENSQLVKKYHNYISWGVTDPHPWVRKSAILALRNYPDIVLKAFEDYIDRKLYIGTFDLIINGIDILPEIDFKKYIEKYDLTEIERNSLLSIINTK